MRSEGQEPLFTMRGAVKAAVYKAEFRPFKANEYLNIAALKKAKEALVEIGSIEVPGVSAVLAAEIHNGAITGIRPVSSHVHPRRGRGMKATKAERKKATTEVLKRVRDGGHPVVQLPIRITSAQSFSIPIGPIIIVIDWPPDLCIQVCVPDMCCIFCLSGSDVCLEIGTVVVE